VVLTELAHPILMFGAAVTANHHVCVRESAPDGAVRIKWFMVSPTLAGSARLTERLAEYPGVVSRADVDELVAVGGGPRPPTSAVATR
jgi:hypothetical protein